MKTKKRNSIEEAAGLWKGMKETGAEYERRLRKEWKRRISSETL